MKRWLPAKVQGLLGGGRDRELLKPREVRFGAELRALTRVLPLILVVSAFQPLLLDRSLSEPRALAVFLTYLGLATVLAVWGIVRTAQVKASQDQRPDEVFQSELAHVRFEMQRAAQQYAIRVVHQTGPDAPLLPEAKLGVLTISKRFWTELSPDEQLAALRYVRFDGTRDIRWQKKRYQGLYVGILAIPVITLYVGAGLTAATFGALVAAALSIVGADRLINHLAVGRWNKVARQLELPRAPITIIQKLLEETEDPAERRHLDWVLKAYVSDFPPGSRIREEFGTARHALGEPGEEVRE